MKRKIQIERIYPILTAVLSMLIIVGIGHGVGPIGLFEIFSFPSYFSEFRETQTTYEQDIYISAGVFLIGQLIVIASYFLKNRLKLVFELAGLLTLLIGFYILTFPLEDSLRGLSFGSGIPFLFFAVSSLVINLYKLKKANS